MVANQQSELLGDGETVSREHLVDERLALEAEGTECDPVLGRHFFHQPITPTEQVLVEKMATSQWRSLRALRLQGEAFVDQMVNAPGSIVPKDFGLLIRYQVSADRDFHKAHNELVKTKKQRPNSEIGFEPQILGEEVHVPPNPAPPTPEKEPKKAPVTPISTNSPAEKPTPGFTAAELDFELCPEAVEFFKKTAQKVA